MTDSRNKKRGYVGIANQIWDEVIRRDFTKRQKDILLFIWRLSYGCNQEVALIPMFKDFGLCGIGKGHIGGELKHLELCKVITRNGDRYQFNENYSIWQISPVRGWEEERFKELIHLNLNNAKKQRKSVTETGTKTPKEPNKDGSQNGDFGNGSELPKQEPKEEVPVTKTGTENENQLLKQELSVTKTGTETAVQPIQGAASEPPKDILNTKDIKDNINICPTEFDKFWAHYPRKVRKKEALNKFESLVKKKIDPSLLIRCSENYAAHCKENVSEERFILHAATFLNAKEERYMDYAEERDYGEKRNILSERKGERLTPEQLRALERGGGRT